MPVVALLLPLSVCLTQIPPPFSIAPGSPAESGPAGGCQVHVGSPCGQFPREHGGEGEGGEGEGRPGVFSSGPGVSLWGEPSAGSPPQQALSTKAEAVLLPTLPGAGALSPVGSFPRAAVGK